MIKFERYYNDNYDKWVNLLTNMIHDREEAEDRIQNIFVGLIPRTEFCEGLITRGEMDKYLWCVVTRQRAQVFREKYKHPPTVSIDTDNIDFLSSISGGGRDMAVGTEVELEDFYKKAIGLLVNPRKLTSECGIDNVGDVRQYILVQYARNGRTFQEIGQLLSTTGQNVAAHYSKIVVILTPMIEEFIGRKLNPK